MLLNLGNLVVNNWIYAIPDGFVLIDTGYENGYNNLKKKLSLYNIDVRNIRYIFLTHAHDDHAGFLNQIMEESPNTEIIMSHKALVTLYKGQNSFKGGCTSKLALVFCKFMKIIGKGSHRFPPLNPEFQKRCFLVSNDNRKIAEKKLFGKIIDTPGHTADSISLLLNNGALFCGDAAMNGLPSLNKITIWIENKRLFLQSWKTIIRSRPRMIYPGHGNAFEYKALRRNFRKLRKVNRFPLKATK